MQTAGVSNKRKRRGSEWPKQLKNLGLNYSLRYSPCRVEMGSYIFLLVFCLHLSFAKSPEPQYALIVPAVLHSDTPNQACVQLHNLNESVSLDITLEYNMDHYDLWEGSVDENDFSQCVNFTVPPAASEPLAFVVLSVKGASLHFHERSSVALRNRSTAVFIQTDKPIYKPGQKIMFRVITLDEDYKPVNRTYPMIYITDPQGNRITQWENQASSNGFLQLELQLDAYPNLGNYGISVDDGTSHVNHWFDVDEYVLPKFSVKTNLPRRVSPFDEEFSVKVCAKYTYGQPVQGTVQLRVCRQHYYHPRCEQDSDGICEALNAELGKDGCISEMISTKAFRLYATLGRDRYFYVMLQINAVVTENGTGIQKSINNYVSVYQSKKTITWEQTDPSYKRGIPYTGKIRLGDEDDVPIANGLVFLELDGEVVANYTTDANGMAQFSIKTSSLSMPRYKLRAFPQLDQCTDSSWLEREEPEAILYIHRFFSRTDSFLKAEPVLEELQCGQQSLVTVHYILKKDRQEEQTATSLDFFYILMTEGKVVASGKQQVHVTFGQPGTFSVSLDVDYRLAPRAKMLVYILHDGELVADSTLLRVENCFRNKVSLKFSEKQALPAASVNLDIKAASNSFCALQAVDKSVLLLRRGADLSPEIVYNRFSHMHSYGYYYGGLNLEDDPKEACIPLTETFFNGLYYLPVNVTNDRNVYDIIKDLGLKVFTSSPLRKPVVCQSDLECKKISSGYGERGIALSESMRYSSSPSGGFIETTRHFFPETWLWNIVPVNSSGQASLSYTVPDTITEWEASMFCVEDHTGFGISRATHLTTFQPFFVELTLPYSLIRGESFILKANAFNYLNQSIEVRAMLGESQDYKAENLSPENTFKRIDANERKTYTWKIHPQKLGTVNFTVTAEAKQGELSQGRRDTVIRPLLVEPEGVKKEMSQSALVCVKGTSASESISLKLPQNVVEGSERASFAVVGDIMGTAMRNTESLLQMPSGCGEQNIAMFLANLIILNYLNVTKQLTEEKRSLFIARLTTGYQRHLTYRLPDGSFSTFGKRDGEGNLWLTVLTYKALARSKDYIFVDNNILNQALIWIASKQKPDGCFQQPGKIFNNAVKEGVNDTLIQTASVAASLLEAGRPTSFPVVQQCLSCLDVAAAKGVEVTYEKALLAYAYSKAGDEEKQRKLLEDLKTSATRTGGLLYLERERRPAAEAFLSFHPRAPSADIEMNSYVLLALVNQHSLSQEHLAFAAQVAQWIVKQQNPYGGFASTQDTHIALQALSQYGALTFIKDARNTVKITDGGPFQEFFQVDQRNSALLQQVVLPSIPGDYRVEVTGSGCTYVQTTLRYNIILPSQASGFSLAVQTKNASCTGNFLPQFHLVLTARYTGKRNVSNMAIIDIKMLSGFVPVQSSLQQLQSKVMRTETKNDHVLLYLDNVSSQAITLTLIVEESYPVSNSKPAQVKIYDYYETDESALAEYDTPCPQSSS
ncbi:ovostatin-like [Eublepharis macularius]|uniref:Ovostatin-like n=1 Tax=Eublepharis macularius TaxID=481883 RepID=A0AA97LJX9_EUBMA|nr:ovostatin-like [Eublepharis macularius]